MAQKSSRQLAQDARELSDNLVTYQLELKLAAKSGRVDGKAAVALNNSIDATYNNLKQLRIELLRVNF
ncbi:MAG: hypothetical protein Q4Q25_03270 [Methanocorpusculum sp.]|nr:hypothetical protein [Methanocorpusculum sp.]